MKKIIFLDMDGVIATPNTIVNGLWSITPECSKNLGIILNKTDAELVITSSWRHITVEDTIEDFKKKEFEYINKIIGVTIHAHRFINKESKIHLSIPRGVEIKQWIDTNIHSNNGKEYDRKEYGKDYTYVILDDDCDMLLEHKDNFIKCNWETGLTTEQAFKAIHILNNYNNRKEP